MAAAAAPRRGEGYSFSESSFNKNDRRIFHDSFHEDFPEILLDVIKKNGEVNEFFDFLAESFRGREFTNASFSESLDSATEQMVCMLGCNSDGYIEEERSKFRSIVERTLKNISIFSCTTLNEQSLECYTMPNFYNSKDVEYFYAKVANLTKLAKLPELSEVKKQKMWDIFARYLSNQTFPNTDLYKKRIQEMAKEIYEKVYDNDPTITSDKIKNDLEKFILPDFRENKDGNICFDNLYNEKVYSAFFRVYLDLRPDNINIARYFFREVASAFSKERLNGETIQITLVELLQEAGFIKSFSQFLHEYGHLSAAFKSLDVDKR